MIYLDHNATRPLLPEVVAAMTLAMASAWGNPSSLHRVGRAARSALDDAREAVALLGGQHARDVVLTSGGTEANNLGIARLFPDFRGLLVTSELEHPSVLSCAEALAGRGVDLRLLVPRDGLLAPDDLERLLATTTREAPRLLATHAVHPETGAVQPVQALLRIAEAHGAEMHLDAVQAAGRVDPALFRGASSLALAAHKLGGPKGIGALVHRPGVVLRPLLFGGAQERGIRPGTPDPIAATGFAVAARAALLSPVLWEAVRPLTDRLERALLATDGGQGAPVITHPGERAPHVLHLAFPGWAGDELVAALDLEGVCISAGSACSAGTSEPSRAVRALRGDSHARASVRISLGPGTTEEEIELAVAAFRRVLGRRSRRL